MCFKIFLIILNYFINYFEKAGLKFFNLTVLFNPLKILQDRKIVFNQFCNFHLDLISLQ